jgi:hypothetical protein
MAMGRLYFYPHHACPSGTSLPVLYCLASQYIANPFLVHGYKFDLRIYVLVRCCDPLRVFIHNEVRQAPGCHHACSYCPAKAFRGLKRGARAFLPQACADLPVQYFHSPSAASNKNGHLP